MRLGVIRAFGYPQGRRVAVSSVTVQTTERVGYPCCALRALTAPQFAHPVLSRFGDGFGHFTSSRSPHLSHSQRVGRGAIPGLASTGGGRRLSLLRVALRPDPQAQADRRLSLLLRALRSDRIVAQVALVALISG